MTTRKLGFTALMTAVYDRLKAYSLTKDYKIYNYVPPSTTMPYIRIGLPVGGRSAMFGSRDYEAEDNVVTIHVFSNATHDYEAAGIMDNIVQALTSSDLSISGYSYMAGFLDFSEIIVDDSEPANIVRHGLIRMRFHLIPT
jgi:hypothetical protein